MKMYWVYDLPNWLFGTLTVGVFVAFGLAGLYLTRSWMRRLGTMRMPTTTSSVSTWRGLLSCTQLVLAC